MSAKLQESYFQAEYIYVAAVLFALMWSQNRKLQFKKRISRQRTCSATITDDEKVIIALEIQNLFVECSNQKLKDFLPLEIQKSKQTYLEKLKGLFGYGAYYKIMCQKSRIKNFLKGLNSLENAEVYLYTSMNKSFTEKILKKLGIEDYFPEQFRRYCEEQDIRINQKKHPSWVDHNTRRVMIVTPNKDDFDEEDRRYILSVHKVKKHKLLKSTLFLIKHIVEKLESVDQLHAEMDQVKAQIQSDYQNEEILDV